jgi:hypothetical protein
MLTNEMRQHLNRRVWDAIALFSVVCLFGLLMISYAFQSVVDTIGVALGVLLGGAFAYYIIPVRVTVLYLNNDELGVEEKLDELLLSQDRRSVWYIVVLLELFCFIIAIFLGINDKWSSRNLILVVVWALCSYGIVNQGYWLYVYLQILRSYKHGKGS